MNTELHVLYTSSDAYAVPAGVSIYSLLKNNQHIESLHVLLVGDGLRPETMAKLDRIASRFGREIDHIDGKEIGDRLERHGCAKYNGSYAAFFKLFALPAVRRRYPQIKKLVYIDSDTVVTGPLDELAGIDMGENDVSCVYELFPATERKRLKLTPSAQTVNSGVCVIDADNWEKHGVENRIIALLQDREYTDRLLFADQDVLNSQRAAAMQRLPVKYNVTTFNYYLRPTSKYVRRFRIGPGFYSDQEVEDAVRTPAVVHYLSLMLGRPWDVPNANPFTGIYERYKSECLPDETMPGKRRGLLRKMIRNVLLWMYRHFPMKVLGNMTSLAIWIYNCLDSARISKHSGPRA